MCIISLHFKTEDGLIANEEMRMPALTSEDVGIS